MEWKESWNRKIYFVYYGKVVYPNVITGFRIYKLGANDAIRMNDATYEYGCDYDYLQ